MAGPHSPSQITKTAIRWRANSRENERNLSNVFQDVPTRIPAKKFNGQAKPQRVTASDC